MHHHGWPSTGTAHPAYVCLFSVCRQQPASQILAAMPEIRRNQAKACVVQHRAGKRLVRLQLSQACTPRRDHKNHPARKKWAATPRHPTPHVHASPLPKSHNPDSNTSCCTPAALITQHSLTAGYSNRLQTSPLGGAPHAARTHDTQPHAHHLS